MPMSTLCCRATEPRLRIPCGNQTGCCWRPPYAMRKLRSARGSRRSETAGACATQRLSCGGRRAAAMPSSPHCTCAQATRNAIAAGADHIEHAMFLVDEEGHQRFEADVADAVAQRDAAVTSTLCVGHFLVDALSAGEGTPDARAAVERWRRMNDSNADHVRRMRQAGVRYVAGTDAGWRFTPFDGLVTELSLLRQTGASAGDAIVAATSGAAAAMEVAGEVGTL